VITVFEAKLEELVAQGPDPDRVVTTLTANPLETLTNYTRCVSASGPQMVSDAMLWFHKDAIDCAIINGGFVRGDTTYPPGHQLLYRNLMTEMPFPKNTTVVRIKGRDLKEAVDQQLRFAPKPSGAFPHYSHNVRVRL